MVFSNDFSSVNTVGKTFTSRIPLDRHCTRTGAVAILIVLLLLSPMYLTLAQWGPDVRLSNGPQSSLTFLGRYIAVAGEILHVVWQDYRHGAGEIYYIASADGGTTWSPEGRLTNNSASSSTPQIWVSGPDVHVVWNDERNGNEEIYYKRSTNGGFSWGVDTRLTNNSAASRNPSITVAGAIVHVVWADERDGNEEIYYKASADGGGTWSPDARLTNASGRSRRPSVWVSGPDVHVVWYDERHGQFEIYYKRSTNGGFSWGADTRLTNHAGSSYNPSVSVAGQIVHVVWQDERDVNFPRIYYKASSNGGATWSPDGRLTESRGQAPQVFVSGPDVHVVWEDMREGESEIFHKLSVNGGFSWGTDTRLTNNPARSDFPSIAVSGSKVHVVWSDDRRGHLDFEVYYKRNPNYLVAVPDQDWEMPRGFSLSQNYPNPFNPTTTIRYEMAVPAYVSLKMYDILGREVATLVNEEMDPGRHEVTWDATGMASGVYFYRLQAGEFSRTRRLLLLR